MDWHPAEPANANENNATAIFGRRQKRFTIELRKQIARLGMVALIGAEAFKSMQIWLDSKKKKRMADEAFGTLLMALVLFKSGKQA